MRITIRTVDRFGSLAAPQNSTILMSAFGAERTSKSLEIRNSGGSFRPEADIRTVSASLRGQIPFLSSPA